MTELDVRFPPSLVPLLVDVATLQADPANARPKRPWGTTGTSVPCRRCGTVFWRYKSNETRLFCSHVCASAAKAKHPLESRTCATCGRGFLIRLRPHSNSAGRFCSLTCRNEGYVGMYRGLPAPGIRGHRPRWTSTRRRFLKTNSFCCGCGQTEGRIEVHHVKPYRIDRDDRAWNLVSTCPGCHAKLDRISAVIEKKSPNVQVLAVHLVQAYLGDWWHVHAGRAAEGQT